MKRFFSILASAALGMALVANGEELPAFQLRPAAQVSSEGVFLDQLIQCTSSVPAVRLCDAPTLGKNTVITREQARDLCRQAGFNLEENNWTGAAAVQINRRSRLLGEAEGLKLLTAALQEQYVKERGELDLRLTRPWAPILVPDEPIKLKVLEMPTMGVTPSFIVRFQIESGRDEHQGPWQVPVQARVWNEIWVTRSALKRGELLSEAELVRERRDVLTIREPFVDVDFEAALLEVAESVAPGTPLLARLIKARPVVHRGEMVAGVLQEGAMAITLKLEALEDGAPGQVIRVRNPVSRRDLRGKVLDEQRVRILL